MTDSKDYSKIFQERLISTRNLRKMTQKELSLKSSMNTTQIAYFESGSRVPSFDSICKLADGLSVSIDYLIGRSNKPESFYLAFRFEDYIDILDKNDIDLLEYQIKEILKKKDNLVKLRIVRKPLEYNDIINILKNDDYKLHIQDLKIHILMESIEGFNKQDKIYVFTNLLIFLLNTLQFSDELTNINYVKNLFLSCDSFEQLDKKFNKALNKQNKDQNKVLVIVQNGVVTDVIKDDSVEVEIFDHDNFKEGDDWSIPEGFENIVPESSRCDTE